VELLIQELVVLVQRSEEYTGFMAAHCLELPQYFAKPFIAVVAAAPGQL
jgi:hypothetical protein